MKDVVAAFQQALLTHRVTSRFVEAKEFPSEEARKKYMQDHPQADPKKHTVKEPGSKGKKKPQPAAKRPTQDPIYKKFRGDVTKWTQKQNGQVAEELSKRPMDQLVRQKALLDTEENEAERAKDDTKLREIWVKQLHFQSAISKKKGRGED